MKKTLFVSGFAWGAMLVGCGGRTIGQSTQTTQLRDASAERTLSDPPSGTACRHSTETGPLSSCPIVSGPAPAFRPTKKWTWTLPDPQPAVSIVPLVGNFTDDNGDGRVDTCDIPDIVVSAPSALVLLNGATGALERTLQGPYEIATHATPAFGDLDGNGLLEIVAHTKDGYLLVLSPEGQVLHKSARPVGHWGLPSQQCRAVSIHDLDGDGLAEVISGYEVYSARAELLFSHAVPESRLRACPIATAADLDDDGRLEVIFGNAAYRADGRPLWNVEGPSGLAHVANFDEDPAPEVLFTREDGLLLVEHDGQVKFGPTRPHEWESASFTCWHRPVVVDDYDGDGRADIAMPTCLAFGVFSVDSRGLRVIRSFARDDSGLAGAASFDFLGRGAPLVMYGDAKRLHIFDPLSGNKVGEVAQQAINQFDYPVVVDVDNDQSADVVVASRDGGSAITVFEDAEKRWRPTRRIWNQHAYHVTNVDEDGSIPRRPEPSWRRHNSFRVNPRLEGESECRSRPGAGR